MIAQHKDRKFTPVIQMRGQSLEEKSNQKFPCKFPLKITFPRWGPHPDRALLAGPDLHKDELAFSSPTGCVGDLPNDEHQLYRHGHYSRSINATVSRDLYFQQALWRNTISGSFSLGENLLKAERRWLPNHRKNFSLKVLTEKVVI